MTTEQTPTAGGGQDGGGRRVAPDGTDLEGGFHKVGERLLQQGAVVSMHEVQLRSPDGEPMDRDVVRHPGAVSVVPLHDDQTVTLVRQFRTPLERYVLEVPAGKRDVADEPPIQTARRELAEEVGFEALEFVKLIELDHSPGFCDEINHIFVATGITEGDARVDGPEESHMTTHRVPLDDALSMIALGEISDAKTVVGLLLTKRWLSGDGVPLGLATR